MQRTSPSSRSIEQARKVSHCLKGVSHDLRLRVLMALKEGELNVSSLAEIVESPQPTLSQHLALMRDRGIIQARRAGNQIFYGVADDRIFKMLDLLKAIFCDPKEK